MARLSEACAKVREGQTSRRALHHRFGADLFDARPTSGTYATIDKRPNGKRSAATVEESEQGVRMALYRCKALCFRHRIMNSARERQTMAVKRWTEHRLRAPQRVRPDALLHGDYCESRRTRREPQRWPDAVDS